MFRLSMLTLKARCLEESKIFFSTVTNVATLMLLIKTFSISVFYNMINWLAFEGEINVFILFIFFNM